MKKSISILIALAALSFRLEAQQAYFIDGYHGGIYGHYPVGQTSFIASKLHQHPTWRINVEIEPETWDTVKRRDPEGYEVFRRLFEDQSVETGRIEYVNPTYAQSYFFCTSGESIVRQFEYGMRLVRQHFPQAVFTTYSAEEPCFTSCLPSLLKSLGFSYAATKNPNTMWGGYVSAYGGELVNWIGPDGTKLLTVPRYACEALQPGSCWQSIAWNNSPSYIRKCLEAGIRHPVGMCLQDAAWSHGWDKGPWLGQDTSAYYTPTAYQTWRHYIAKCSSGSASDDWHASQEDIAGGLMWGTQIMQRLAREVRDAENAIVQAEKIAALACLYQGADWPSARLDEGWRTLLLSQHHDCWIVPYNQLQGKKSWAETATDWTGITRRNSRQVIDNALARWNGNEGEPVIRIYNTLAAEREELASVEVPEAWKNTGWVVVDDRGNAHPAQWTRENEVSKLVFRAKVPPVGFATYRIRKATQPAATGPAAKRLENGTFLLESDLYRLVLNPAKGGVVESLQAKAIGRKEFVDRKHERGFTELRGYFQEEAAFLSSTGHPATVRVVEQGPLFVKVAVEGRIGKHPFTQTIRLAQGEARMDGSLKIDWAGSPRIGEPGIEFRADNPRKAFYDDRYKLLLYLPVAIEDQQIYKDAPFDVCQSRLENTFFTRWDSIKHNIILSWVDVAGKGNTYGLSLFSDHTTSYAHGTDFPLALNVQYAGTGLWGREYVIDRPTEFSYALRPHAGSWETNRIWTESERLREPLVAVLTKDSVVQSSSFLQVEGNAYELVSMVYKGNDLYVRLFNAQSDEAPKKICFHACNLEASLVELDGRIKEKLSVTKKQDGCQVQVHIPRYGIRTIRLRSILLPDSR